MTHYELKYRIEETFGLDDLFKKTRKHKYIFARALFYKILNIKGKSFTDIGRIAGRTHATIMNGIKLWDNHIEKNEKKHAEFYYKYRYCRAGVEVREVNLVRNIVVV